MAGIAASSPSFIIAPNAVSQLREANRPLASPKTKFESFKCTFRSSLYEDPTKKPTRLAHTNRDMIKRASLAGKITDEDRKKLLALNYSMERKSQHLETPIIISKRDKNARLKQEHERRKNWAEDRQTKRKIAKKVLAKHTNHRLYTGTHKHRFDFQTGKGRGKAGRDTVAKGNAHTPDPTRTHSTLNKTDAYYKKHGLPSFQPAILHQVPDLHLGKKQAHRAVMKRMGHLMNEEDYVDTLDGDEYYYDNSMNFFRHVKHRRSRAERDDEMTFNEPSLPLPHYMDTIYGIQNSHEKEMKSPQQSYQCGSLTGIRSNVKGKDETGQHNVKARARGGQFTEEDMQALEDKFDALFNQPRRNGLIHLLEECRDEHP